MATSRPISTISYNTLPFLRQKLEELVTAHKIQAYMYIFHKGEDGDKDHVHLRVIPNTRLDPMVLSEFFKEPDLKFPQNKPLGVRPWRPSQEEDWLLYAVHDKDYMKLKYSDDPHEKIEYKDSDIVVSDMFDLDIAMVRARASLAHHATNLLASMQQGVSAPDLVKRGENITTIRTLQMILGNFHNKFEFDQLEKNYQIVCSQRYQLENFLFDLGYICSYSQQGELTIEKIYDNI